MDITELRIGNYIEHDQYPSDRVIIKIITGVHIDACKELKARPIPLTEEWLLKMGFERSKQPNGHIFYGNRAFGMRIIGHPYNDGYILFGYEGSVDIPYVHILQNLYRCLTGTELEIK